MTTKKGPAEAPAMKVARIYLRVSTEEQDLSRQAAIVVSFSEDDCTEYQKSAARPSPMPISRLLKYYPYGRTCSAAASAFVAAVSVF